MTNGDSRAKTTLLLDMNLIREQSDGGDQLSEGGNFKKRAINHNFSQTTKTKKQVAFPKLANSIKSKFSYNEFMDHDGTRSFMAGKLKNPKNDPKN